MDIRQKLKKIPVPGFVKKIRLDRRLQAVLAFVAVLCCLLLFFHFYNMKYVSSLRYDSTVVTDSQIAAELLQGTAENGTTRWMEAFPEGEAVYRRGSSYFIGDQYVKVQSAMPMLADQGTYLSTFDGNSYLYMEDWSRQQGFAGMFISDGEVFNYDGSHTGDDKVLFLQLSNGLYMNAQPLALQGTLHRLVIEKNSYLYIGTEEIRFYGQKDGTELTYGSMGTTYEMQVSIGGQTLTYEELLRYLGLLGDDEGFTPIPAPEDIKDAESPEEPNVFDGQEGSATGADASEDEELEDTDADSEEQGSEEKNGTSGRDSAGGSSVGQQAPAGSSAGAPGSGPSGSSASGTASESGGSGSDTGSGSGEESSSEDSDSSGDGSTSENVPGGASGEAGEPGSAGDTEVPADPGVNEDKDGTKDPDGDRGQADLDENPGSGNNSGNSGNTEPAVDPDGEWTDGTSDGQGGGGTGGTGTWGGDATVPWSKPQIRFSNLETDVYLLTGTMEVNDRSYAMNKVILNFEWDGEVRYRRTVKEAGDFYADNLPPDTTITVTPVLYYYDEDGVKVEEYQDGTVQEDGTTSEDLRFEITMKSRTEMDYIYLKFSDNITDSTSNVWYENQISSYRMQLSSTNSNTVGKISKMTMEIYKKGDNKAYASTTVRSNSLQAYFENETGLDYLTLRSQAFLDADTEYMYCFRLVDSFGVELPNVAWGYVGGSLNGDDESLKVTGYDDASALPTDLYDPRDPAKYVDDAGVENDPHWAYTHTSKTKPSATVKTAASKVKKENLSEIRFTVQMSDPCQALMACEDNGQSMPSLNGQPYNVYYQVFESSDAEQPLMLKALPESTETVIVEVENEDGTTSDRTVTRRVLNAEVSAEEGTDRIYLDVDSFDRTDWEDLVYHLEGLTAGKNYQIRVFADYDLNDNQGTEKSALIGSSSFATTTMSSYGRIYYSFESSHVKTPYGPGQEVNVNTYDHDKYESSTAQQIRMRLGSRTNADLAVNYYDSFEAAFQLKGGTKDEILRLSFHKDAQENGETGLLNHVISYKEEDLEALKAAGTVVGDCYIVTLQGSDQEGVYDLLDQGKSVDFLYRVGSASGYEERYRNAFDSQLEIRMEIPLNLFNERIDDGTTGDKHYEISLWEAFANKDFATSPTVIQFMFEEGSIDSFTGYTLATTSTALQGGEEHSVTASTSSGRQVSFTTLKDMPYVTIPEGSMLQVGKYLYILNMELHDTDNSIQNGQVTVTNRLATSRTGTSKTFQLDYSASSGGTIARVEFTNLREDSDYVLEIAPNDIRRTGKTATYRYLNEVLRTITYRTGQGLTGGITMTGISYPLNQLSQNTDYHTLTEYNRYEVGNFQYGFPTVNADGTVSMHSVAYYNQTMDSIAVEPGQVYYLNHLGHDGYLVMLDGDRKAVGTVRRVYNEGLIKIPEGVYYLQASMTGSDTDGKRTSVSNSSRAQVLLVYDPIEKNGQTKLNELGIVSAPQTGSTSYTLDVGEGDMVAVVSAEWTSASAGNSNVTADCRILDKDGKEIGKGSINTSYKGYHFLITNPAAAQVQITFNTPLYGKNGAAVMPDVRVIDKEKLDAFSDYNYDALITNYTVTVEDKGGNLVDSPEVYVAVFEADTAEPTGSFDVEAGSGPVCSGSWKLNQSLSQLDRLTYEGSQNIPFEKNYTFQATQGHSYGMVLYVKWMGDYYKLDEQDFTAEGAVYTISSGTQLLKTVAWPNAKFMVVDDLLVDANTRTLLNQSFNGQLDGQGYALKTVYTTSSTNVFSSIGGSGVIENLDITEVFDGRTPGNRLRWTYFTQNNYGTIRNVVVHMNLGSGNYSHQDIAGLVWHNYGLIENAAIYFESDTTIQWSEDTEAETYVNSGRWGSYSGGAVSTNYGTIRNAIVYSNSYLTATTGVYKGSDAVSLAAVGGIAGSNTGTIENVMALFSMAGERNSSQTSIGALNSIGLIVGSNSGKITNSFTSGDLYYMEWDGAVRVNTPISDYRAWPGASESSSARENNCYYFSADSYKSNNAYTRYQSNALVLTTGDFYDTSVNKTGQFLVQEQLDMGFFPILQMPECMEGAQKDLQLSNAVAGTVPTYIAGSVEEIHYPDEEITDEAYQALPAGVQQYYEQKGEGWRVKRQYAVARITMSNLGGYTFQKINVRYLDSTILSQTNADSRSVLEVALTPASETTANGYTSQHVVESFVYGTGDGYTRTVSNQTLAIDFYMPLSQDNWLTAPVSSAINYMLVEDVTFDSAHFGSNLASAVNKFAASDFRFTGIFDGHGHTLDYSGASVNSTQPWIVYQLSAGSVWKDVHVHGLTLPATSAEYEGYIRSAQTGSEIQGIHFTDPALEGVYRYGGVLAASVGVVTIRDCTVSGLEGMVEIRSNSNATGLYVGGLIGCGPSTGTIRIENCYVSDLEMNIAQGTQVSAVGGMAGYLGSGASTYNYPQVTGCYVSGKIDTAFLNCGGLVGRGFGQYSNIWTDVDINGTGNVGALLGYAGQYFNIYSSVVVSGELYSSNGSIPDRLVGKWPSGTASTILSSWASSGQLLNTETSTELLGTEGLGSFAGDDVSTKMGTYQFWWDNAGFSTEVFHVYGSEEAGIPDVKTEAVYPVLYNYEHTELLPNQKVHYYESEVLDMKIVSAKAAAREEEGTGGSYDLEVTMQVPMSGTDLKAYYEQNVKGKLSADGLVFHEENDSDVEYTTVPVVDEETQTTKDYFQITYHNVEAEKRFDSYRAMFQYADGSSTASVSSKLIFTDAESGEETPLYWHIGGEGTDALNAQEWETVVKDHGNGYENFRVFEDMDFSGITSLSCGLKLNRLEGTGAPDESAYDLMDTKEWINDPQFCSISGFTIRTSQNWISEIATYLGYLDFRNLTSAYQQESQDYAGVIGQVLGDASYIDFYNINLSVSQGSGSYNYMGCVGYSDGMMQNVRAADVEYTNTIYYYSYVGGLCGYGRNLQNVHAFATAEGTYSVVGGALTSSYTRNYTGGIAGYIGAVGENLYADDLTVTGNQYVGAVSGEIYRMTDAGYRGNDDGLRMSVEVRNCTVNGKGSVGGAFGTYDSSTGTRLFNVRVMGTSVYTNGNDAGGVIGRSGGGNYLEAYGCTVQAGGQNAGGLVGYALYGATVHGSKVHGCKVTAGNYAGGIVGNGRQSYGVSIYNSAVAESSIKATGDYAGGLAGAISSSQGSNHTVYQNAVSSTTVSGGNNVGGLIGAAAGSLVYSNEVDDTVTVTGSLNYTGGVVGFSSGGSYYNNIVGCAVNGKTYVGGLAGYMVGYGTSMTTGGFIVNPVSKAYSNIIACSGIRAENYAGGLLGTYIPGEEPMDGDGNVIPNSGWSQRMLQANYYANLIAPKGFDCTGARQDWYANYEDSTFTLLNPPSYDRISASFAEKMKLTVNPYKVVDGSTGLVDYSGWLCVTTEDLKEPKFYTGTLASGGMGMNTRTKTEDVGNGYYPYIESAYTPIGGAATTSVVYQKRGDLAVDMFNSYFEQNVDGTWKRTAFGGEGIPIDDVSGASLLSAREATDNMVYVSGVDTVNLDFTNVGTQYMTFDIRDTDGNLLLEEQEIRSEETDNYVFTMSYGFQKDFVVTVYASDHSRSLSTTCLADSLRKTVMAWEEQYYYLKSDGVYKAGSAEEDPELCEEGTFVNLYQGKALREDGAVIRLN